MSISATAKHSKPMAIFNMVFEGKEGYKNMLMVVFN